MFGSTLIKFPMLILKRQVNSSSNFASFFIVMTHNPTVNFNLILLLLWIEGSHQSPNFDIFNYSGENLSYSSCYFPNHFSSNIASLFRVMKNNSSVFFLGQTINTLHNRNQWNCKFLILSSARFKNHQIRVNFETTDQFFAKVCINLQGSET